VNSERIRPNNIHAEKSLNRSHRADAEGLAKLVGESVNGAVVLGENENVININSDNDAIEGTMNEDAVVCC